MLGKEGTVEQFPRQKFLLLVVLIHFVYESNKSRVLFHIVNGGGKIRNVSDCCEKWLGWRQGEGKLAAGMRCDAMMIVAFCCAI